MNISSVNSDLIRGNVITIILNCLSENDRYGYDILREIEEKTKGLYKLKQPTLYSCLKRLEQQGFITSYLGSLTDTGGRQRRYYSLTDKGRDYLLKEKREYEFSRSILDKLVSDNSFDPSAGAPFDVESLRPYTKPKLSSPKVIYKEKIIYKYITPEAASAAKKTRGLTGEIPEKETNAVNAIESAAKEEKPETPLNAKEIMPETKLGIEKLTFDRTVKETLPAAQPKAEDSAEQNGYAEFPVVDKSKIKERTLFDLLSELEEKKNKELSERDSNLLRYNSLDDLKQKKIEGIIPERSEEPVKSEKRYSSLAELLNKKAAEIEAEKKVAAALLANDILPKEEDKPTLSDILRKKSEERDFQKPVETPQEYRSAKSKLEEIISRYEAEYNEKLKNEKAKSLETSKEHEIKQVPSEKENTAEAKTEEEKAELEKAPVFEIPKEQVKFDYENSDVNYRDFLLKLTEKKQAEELEVAEPKREPQPFVNDAELKVRLYSEGFKIRPYSRSYAQEYYSFNFMHVNKLRRDSLLLTLITFFALVGACWGTMYDKIPAYVFGIAMGIGAALYLIPLSAAVINPGKRAKAIYNFKFSLLSCIMLYIEICVIIMILGFFLFGADISSLESMLAPVIFPMVSLFAIVVSPLYYLLLFKSKRYHIA